MEMKITAVTIVISLFFRPTNNLYFKPQKIIRVIF